MILFPEFQKGPYGCIGTHGYYRRTAGKRQPSNKELYDTKSRPASKPGSLLDLGQLPSPKSLQMIIRRKGTSTTISGSRDYHYEVLRKELLTAGLRRSASEDTGCNLEGNTG